MKIVIDISEEKYQGIVNIAEEILDPSKFCYPRYLYIAVLNGTPIDAVLDEIRAEIEQEYIKFRNNWEIDMWSEIACGLGKALEIIDRYKAESEGNG